MPSERIPLQYLLDDSHERLMKIAERIGHGEVFVYPTETIYGIGGIVSPDVNRRIAAIKKRELSNPLIMLGDSVETFKKQGVILNKTAIILADAFWPGDLTLAVQTVGGRESVGIRISSNQFVSALFRYLDGPIYSTSANLSGEKYVNDPDYLWKIFKEEIDFMVDAGVLHDSIPSTVVKIGHDGDVDILREGKISKQQIIDALAYCL